MTKPITNEEMADMLVYGVKLEGEAEHEVVLGHLNAACESAKAEAVKAEKERWIKLFKTAFESDNQDEASWAMEAIKQAIEEGDQKVSHPKVEVNDALRKT